METRRLGTSDLTTTPIGIHAWALGGGGWNGSVGPQNDSGSVPAIDAALDHGLNRIDTALYGVGHSETVVVPALKGRSLHPHAFTKCERVWDRDRRPPLYRTEQHRRCDLFAAVRRAAHGAMTKRREANFAAADWRRNLPNFQESPISPNFKSAERWRGIGNRHRRRAGEVAIAWTLDSPAVTGAIVGFGSAQQSSEAAVAAEFRPLPAVRAEIEQARTRESGAEKTEHKF